MDAVQPNGGNRSRCRACRRCDRAGGASATIQAQSNTVLAVPSYCYHRAGRDSAEKAKAEETLAQSEAVPTFPIEAFRSPDPSLDGKDIKVAEVLDRAAERLDREFTGSQATRGAPLQALGETYTGLGLTDPAVKLLERALAVRKEALGAEHPDTLRTQIKAVGLYASFAGRTSEAVKLGEATRNLAEAKLGVDHPDTLECRNNLVEAYLTVGQLAEAVELGEATLKLAKAKLGLDHRDMLGIHGNLATAYFYVGRTAEATLLDEALLTDCESRLGFYHPETLIARKISPAATSLPIRIDEAIVLETITLKIRESS